MVSELPDWQRPAHSVPFEPSGVVIVMGRIPRPPLWNAIWGRFWAVVFVLAFWPVGLVALKLAMPLFTVVIVMIVAVAVVRVVVALVRRKRRGW